MYKDDLDEYFKIETFCIDLCLDMDNGGSRIYDYLPYTAIESCHQNRSNSGKVVSRLKAVDATLVVVYDFTPIVHTESLSIGLCRHSLFLRHSKR